MANRSLQPLAHSGSRPSWPRALYLLLVIPLLAHIPGSRDPSPSALAFAADGLGASRSFPTPTLLYTTLEGETSGVWAAPATDPARARRLAIVDHRGGYGLHAGVSPTGRQMAYLVLPPDKEEPSTQAALWVLDLDGSGSRRLSEDVDLRSVPVWSPDGRSVAVRRTSLVGNTVRHQLLVVDVETSTGRTILEDDAALGMYSIGWTQDGGGLYYARLTERGTDILKVDPLSGTVEHLFHASDGIARDFQLAPGRDHLLYSESVYAEVLYRVVLADLQTGASRVLQESSQPLIGPVWQPDGLTVTFSAIAAGSRVQSTLITRASEATGQKDQSQTFPGSVLGPLAWSPNGAFLAVRLLYGADLGQLTGERLAVVSPVRGIVTKIEARGYAEFVGWLP